MKKILKTIGFSFLSALTFTGTTLLIVKAWTYTDPTPVSDGTALDSGTMNGIIESLFWKRSGTSDITFNGGNVGIGTTDPSYPLHVKTDNILTDIMIEDTTGNRSLIGFKSAASTSVVGIGANIDNLSLYTSGNQERVRILNNGNVGIGTTAPTSKLDVNGEIKATKITATDLKMGEGNLYHSIIAESYCLNLAKDLLIPEMQFGIIWGISSPSDTCINHCINAGFTSSFGRIEYENDSVSNGETYNGTKWRLGEPTRINPAFCCCNN